MKNFVKLIQQAHAERFSAVMNRIVTQQIPVAFLSVAPIAQAVETVKNFRAQGLNISLLIVTDNTPPPADLDFSVVHVTDADKIYPPPEYVFVMSNIDLKFAEHFTECEKIIYNPYVNADNAYETFMAHLDDLREVYASLMDEESRKVFRGYWLARITNRLSECVYANTSQYICAGFTPKAGDIFIDGGSCDGQTAARFAKMDCKVYSFEMDKFYFDIAAKVAAENNFVVENLALGAYRHEMNYTRLQGAHGASRQDRNGTERARVVTLDSYVSDNNLPRVDFIKLDVEGAELDVLRGATTTIARFKPILALSAYHKLDDFWTLMNFVKSIRPDYEFALRQYQFFHEDDPILFDDGVIEFLESFALDVKLATPGECVLFAR